MSRPIISIETLSKAYRIGTKEEVPDTIVGAVKGIIQSPFRNFKNLRSLDTSRSDPATMSSKSGNKNEQDEVLWALRKVSFEVNDGEVVGIIGRNGAGKSTLLKILSRITEPTSGRAIIRGRVSSLLEVGTGFHPELTGRENIYMNGTILGMTKKEIDRKFDEIVEFSGIEKFLDTIAKRYSSGMSVRLAFAVAAHLEPEILIIDEVLAVGDAEFQRRCIGKMKDVASSGRTVLFVSHNMDAVRRLTRSCILLHDGTIAKYDQTEAVLDEYIKLMEDRAGAGKTLDAFRRPRNPGTPVSFVGIKLANTKAANETPLQCGSELEFTFEIHSDITADNASITLTISRNSDSPVVTLLSQDNEREKTKLSCGTNVIKCNVKDLPLLPGKYDVTVGINPHVGAQAWDVIQSYPLIQILNAGDNALRHRPDRPGCVYWKKASWTSELVVH